MPEIERHWGRKEYTNNEISVSLKMGGVLLFIYFLISAVA